MPRGNDKARMAGAGLGLISSVLLAGCSTVPDAPPTPPDPTRAIARSLDIVRSATPEKQRVLKILFYGQSISTPKWTDQAMARLRARYPDVAFDYRNMALGGWAADILEDAAARDVAEAYPDLIVFHVYGDNSAYERIIRTFREKTAADVIIQTDHVVDPVEPVCDTGLHLRWSPPPGCRGHVWFKQNVWEDFMSGVWLPTMAARYDLALEPRRARWDAYLKRHKLEPMALINDAPHPNARGWTLMANLFTSWFETLVSQRTNAPPLDPDAVQSLQLPAPGASATYRFAGNRIELLAAGPLDGKVKVTVDGKAPQDLDGCWQDSRVSRLPNQPDWPALRQVSVAPGYHQADTWTLRLSDFDAAQEKFAFTLSSEKSGPDGQGSSEEAFTSPSGRVSIQPGHWLLAYARRISEKGVPENATFQWQRRFVCNGQPAVALPGGGVEQRFVAATGLANGPHVVEIALAQDAPVVTEVRSYKPPIVN